MLVCVKGSAGWKVEGDEGRLRAMRKPGTLPPPSLPSTFHPHHPHHPQLSTLTTLNLLPSLSSTLYSEGGVAGEGVGVCELEKPQFVHTLFATIIKISTFFVFKITITCRYVQIGLSTVDNSV